MDPFETVPCVSLNDPALDMEASEIAAYREKRDPALIKTKDGMVPTRYFLRALPATALRGLDMQAGIEARVQWLFRAGCHRVELSDGKVLTPDKKKLERQFGVQIAPDEWIVECNDAVGMDILAGMADVIWERSRMSKAQRAPF